MEGLGQDCSTRGFALFQAVAAIGSELCDVGVEEMAVGAVCGGAKHGPEGLEGVLQTNVYFLYGCAEGLKIAGGGFGDA